MSMCPKCGSPDTVGFTLNPGAKPLRLTHCRGCENRWWVDGRTTVALHDVLTTISAA